MKPRVNKSIKVFLSDAKWASGNFATDEEIDVLLDKLPKLDHTKLLSEENAILIETSINALALEIIRFSRTSWSNDYYGEVTSLGDIINWLDKYWKHHKMGRYFSIESV